LEWEAQGDRVIVRRAGLYTSEEIHRALFKLPPKRQSLADLKAGIRRYIRRKHARR
jgi:hypothetical protein